MLLNIMVQEIDTLRLTHWPTVAHTDDLPEPSFFFSDRCSAVTKSIDQSSSTGQSTAVAFLVHHIWQLYAPYLVML